MLRWLQKWFDKFGNVLYLGSSAVLPGIILWLYGLWELPAVAAWIIAAVVGLTNVVCAVLVVINCKDRGEAYAYSEPTRRQTAEYYIPIMLAPALAIFVLIVMKVADESTKGSRP